MARQGTISFGPVPNPRQGWTAYAEDFATDQMHGYMQSSIGQGIEVSYTLLAANLGQDRAVSPSTGETYTVP